MHYDVQENQDVIRRMSLLQIPILVPDIMPLSGIAVRKRSKEQFLSDLRTSEASSPGLLEL